MTGLRKGRTELRGLSSHPINRSAAAAVVHPSTGSTSHNHELQVAEGLQAELALERRVTLAGDELMASLIEHLV
jgi:hypothetical protein